jgi:hypothetical protein
VDYTGTYAFSNDFFLKGDIHYAYSSASYSGSGTKTGIPDWYYEVRGLIGKDFETSNTVLSPYIGYGYRYLFDDLRGTTSTGAAGYRRESNYWYIPIGITHKMNLDQGARQETTFEFDRFLKGKQVSTMSDTVGYNNITRWDGATNSQSSGRGYKIQSLYHTKDWYIGPYYSYWNIDKSNSVYGYAVISGTTYYGSLTEPQNTTKEIGLKIGTKF